MAHDQAEEDGDMADWKYKINNRLRGIDGQTDYDKKTITINKKKSVQPATSLSKAETTIINTIVHEMLHKDHIRMHEKTVRKIARERVKNMSEKQKAKLYSKFS